MGLDLQQSDLISPPFVCPAQPLINGRRAFQLETRLILTSEFAPRLGQVVKGNRLAGFVEEQPAKNAVAAAETANHNADPRSRAVLPIGHLMGPVKTDQ